MKREAVLGVGIGGEERGGGARRENIDNGYEFLKTHADACTAAMSTTTAEK